MMTLARQMYRTNPNELLHHFEDAVNEPYGSLVLDLKPTTPEHLRKNIFQTKEQEHLNSSQSVNDLQPVQTEFPKQRINISQDQIAENQNEIQHLNTNSNWSISNITIMYSCDDRSTVLVNIHDLQSHVKRWCPEQQPRKRKIVYIQSIHSRQKMETFIT